MKKTLKYVNFCMPTIVYLLAWFVGSTLLNDVTNDDTTYNDVLRILTLYGWLAFFGVVMMVGLVKSVPIAKLDGKELIGFTYFIGAITALTVSALFLTTTSYFSVGLALVVVASIGWARFVGQHSR